MINDFQSVRSMPLRPAHKDSQRYYPAPSIYSPSQNSPLPTKRQVPDWRNNLHPQIDQKYNKIVRGQPVSWGFQPVQRRSEDKMNCESTKKSGDSFQTERKQYQGRIRVLQQQNGSLKEQLYYLRQALLINFQNRKQTK